MITHPLIVIPVNLPENMIYIYIYKYMVHFWNSDNTLDDQTQKNIEQTHPWKKGFCMIHVFFQK